MDPGPNGPPGSGPDDGPTDNEGGDFVPGELAEPLGDEEDMYDDEYAEELDDEDVDGLDPDNPVLTRLQEALTKQLLDEDERVTEELRVKDEDLRRAKKKREDIGAELYSVQQQLAKLQMQLESTHDRFKQVNKLREQVETETQQAIEVYQQERQQVVQYKGKVDVNQVELDKVNSTIRQVQAYNEAMKDEVAVTRRATYKAEEATSQLEGDKTKQDTLIDDLNMKIRTGTDQLGLYEAQLSAQQKETGAAGETLFEAAREMEGIAFEKKHLMQQWKSSLIGMSRRDEALQKANEQIAATIEAIGAMASEILGYKREIKEVQDKNEVLTSVLDKLELDLKFIEKSAEAAMQKHQKLAQQYQQIRTALEIKDQDLSLKKKELKRLTDNIAVTQKRIQDIQNQTHVLDSKSAGIHSDQMTIEQGTDNTIKAAGEVQEEVQDLEMQVTNFENELARVRVDALNTQAHNDGLRQTLSSLDTQLREKTELTDRYEGEIRKRNDEIEKKQAEVDRLNRRMAALVAGQEAPEATGDNF
jgi:chromosome segregation ATPase